MSDTPTPISKPSALTALAGFGGVSASDRIGWRLLLLPFLLWGASVLFPPLNHDAAAILFWAQRMVAGDRLYVDLIDVNPPMIFWLNLLPAWLAAKTGLSAAQLLSGGLVLAIVASMAFCRRLVPDLSEDIGPSGQVLLPVVALFVLLIYPAHSFAQREHILLIAALPYLLASAGRGGLAPLSARKRAASAVLIAIAVCMKPHFAILPLLMEAWVLSRMGWRRWLSAPTPWLIAGIGVAYIAASWLLHPAYFAALPAFLSTYAQAEAGTGWRLLSGDQVPALLIGGVIGGIMAFRILPNRLAQALTLFVAATTIAGALQGKGWDYHFLAARAGLILLLVCLGADLIDRYGQGLRAGGWPSRRALALVLLGGLMFSSDALSPPFKLQREFPDTQAGRLARIMAVEARGEPIMWMTSGIYPQFTAMAVTGNPMVGRYMSLWLLPTLYRDGSPYRQPADMGSLERALFNSLARDLSQGKPKLLMVFDANREAGYQGRAFSYIDYAQRHPDFAKAFADYSVLTRLDGWTIYRRP